MGLLQAAVAVVVEANGLAAQRFLEGVPVGRKADGSEVTPADVEVELLIRSRLREQFPQDGVLGEEQGGVAGSSARRWIIDPIDGTAYFTRRIPSFEVLLAAEDEHGCAIGIIGSPMSQEVYYAGRGLGAWRQPIGGPAEPINVSDNRRRRGARVSMMHPGAWSEELLLTLHREVVLTPGMKGAAGVTSGLADAMVSAGTPMDYWDVAPYEVLLAEAGGRVTDLEGNDVRTGNGTVLASNGHIHDALLELVCGIPDSRDYKALINRP